MSGENDSGEREYFRIYLKNSLLITAFFEKFLDIHECEVVEEN